MLCSDNTVKDEDVTNGDTEGREAASGSSPRGDAASSGGVDPKVEKWDLLWDEYKHRHDLIWKVVFQITTAAVVLSVVPYLAPKPVLHHLERWILLVPGLASLLVGFSIIVVGHELALLGEIRKAHRLLQKEVFGIEQDKARKARESDQTDRESDQTDRESDRTEFEAVLSTIRAVLSTGFGKFTCTYLVVLLVLSLLNIAICEVRWIP